MNHDPYHRAPKHAVIPLTRIYWEADVTNRMQLWMEETAQGRFKDETQDVESYFEAQLNRPCIAVSSGTAALHVALRLLSLKPGSEIIIPTLTYAACANVVLYEGLKPVFCDVNPQTWCLRGEELVDTLESRLKAGARIGAVMPVHLYGQACAMQELKEVCNQYGIPVIEDVAQALGGKHAGTNLGSMGNSACFSFNANKVLSGMGGGLLAVRTNEEKHSIRDIIRHGRLPFEDGLAQYVHETMGFNYQISGYSAALIHAQLPYLEDRIARKREIFDTYCRGFQELNDLHPQNGTHSSDHTHWLSCFQVKSGPESRDRLCQTLWQDGIETRPVFKPLHQQPAYKDFTYCGSEHAENIVKTGICFPSSCDLRAIEQEKVIGSVRKALKQ
ncbi:DegT/DnrJ/EryC1/StrS family aminotransferase [Verrucomicrobia bacterium]|nr:DegT/DnrJ/EryC1/StrS family aminotransferase [Verrucomicrobiota bacterium]